MRKIFIPLFLLLMARAVSAASPVLNFSDIDSGPKTGNTDGLGSGAIVTIWGNNLGSSQEASKVYIGGVEASYVYYWKNADGTLPSGPADLYTNHKMQEIAFSVPAGAVDGANTITVSVNGTSSNALPFTVRSGNIYFIKSTGNDTTGNGSWSLPWLTYNNVLRAAGNKLSAGDIVYSVGVNTTGGVRIGGSGNMPGTAALPYALVAYPNTRCNISGHGGNGAVICNWYPDAYPNKSYVNLSKLSVTASGNSASDGAPMGIEAIPYNRIVGVEITGPNVYGGYYGAIGASGAGSNPIRGGKYLGIYIHNYGYRSTTPGLNNYSYIFQLNSSTWTSPVPTPYNGVGDACTNCTSMDQFQHLYYLSIRQNNTMVDPYEIGWNNLVNNPILEGIHIYDQDTTGSGFNAPVKVYNNWIENQGGAFFDLSLPYPSVSAVVQLYNNVMVCNNTQYTGPAIVHAGNETVYFYNNTFYGYRITGMSNGGTGSGPMYFKNNILIDTLGFTFSSFTPSSVSNNLFYSTMSTGLPSWYSAGNGDLNTNPLFTNASAKDFTPLSGSAAKSAGVNFSGMFTTDFFSSPRTTWDLGAINVTGAPSDTTPPAAPDGLAVQ